MWPFRREKSVSVVKRSLERIVAGFIIGSAISYTLGKKLSEQDEEEDLDEAQESEDDTL